MFTSPIWFRAHLGGIVVGATMDNHRPTNIGSLEFYPAPPRFGEMSGEIAFNPMPCAVTRWHNVTC
jgi:hypothetical protein